jgi:glycosyltransferase involved in cell wall biosynthesis
MSSFSLSSSEPAAPRMSGVDDSDPIVIDPAVTVVMFVADSPERWLLSVRSVLRKTRYRIVVGVLYPIHGSAFDGIDDERLSWGGVGSVSELIDRTYGATGGHVLVINDAVSLPDEPFRTALEWVQADLRVATVSFLGNASGALSFPLRNSPVGRPPDGHDEQSVTRTIRASLPRQRPAPLPIATGPVVLISASSFGAIGAFEAPPSARFDVAIADFSARASQKGFVNLADTTTFISRTADTSISPIDEDMRADDRGWLLHRYRFLIETLEKHRGSGDSPFAHQYQLARVKSQGLRILVDGSCFGPHETGTQVATAHTIRALCEHQGVAWVGVALPGPKPSYASEVLNHPKVDARQTLDPSMFGIVDIAFRPFQPTEGYDATLWRQHSVRYVVSILDVIAYSNGSYFPESGSWTRYRGAIDDVIAVADGVTVISGDVRTQMHLHGLAIEDERITVVPLGTEHLGSSSTARYPDELATRGFSGKRFALTLGVNYHHKNRDLAIAAHRELRRNGFDLDLVLAGPAVPYGTSRLAESAQRFADRSSDSWLHVLPEVHEHERNWLLSHAALAWYPTSAEGFGLPPFEAAVFGVPAVSVGFGPLSELAGNPGAGELPLQAASWAPDALAAVAVRLLRDPGLSAAHCAALMASGRQYSWESHADRLVLVFRELLATPRRRSI